VSKDSKQLGQERVGGSAGRAVQQKEILKNSKMEEIFKKKKKDQGISLTQKYL
jgi:hypothetical protein